MFGFLPFCVLECLIFLSTILIMIFCLLLFLQFYLTEFNNFKIISNNWQKGPITDIIASTTYECPRDYEPMIDDSWPGLIDSCVCSEFVTNNLFEGRVRRGVCRSKRDTLLLCSNKPQLNPVKYKVYKGKTLCAKRLNMGLLDLSISSKASLCPIGTRSCGKADSLQNYLCIPNLSPCPINTIKILNKNEVILPANFNYTRIDLANKVLYFTNQNTEGQIIDEFKVSQNQPCAEPSYINTNASLYILDPFLYRSGCLEKIGNETTDIRYNIIDEHSNLDLLNENNITSILRQYPDYPLNNLNFNVKLYYRSYIGINEKCFNFFKSNRNTNQVQTNSTKGILFKLNHISSFTEESKSLSFLNAVYVETGVLIVFASQVFLFFYIKFNEEKYFESIICQFIMKIVYILILLIMCVLTLLLYSSLKKVPDVQSEIINNGFSSCGDFYTNVNFEKLGNSMKSAKTLSICNLVFSVVSIISSSIIIPLLCIYRRKENANYQSFHTEI